MSAAPPRPAAAKPAPPAKRSLTLQGHRTSVSLEPAFWEAFRALAARRGLALNALAARIDAGRPPEVGLASAIRLAVLADLETRLAAAEGADAGGAQPMVASAGKVSSSQ